uniref:Skp1_POZ domain-containing protein n=1 Tax=Panagrellus redivivus TaxID=6233 RepID=A0A7E4ZUB5_PANRE
MPRNRKSLPYSEFKIITKDDECFTIGKLELLQMNVLKHLFIDVTADNNEVKLHNISSTSFKIIVDYAKLYLHDDHYAVREIGPHTLHLKDYTFLKNYEEHFNELLVATDYLDFPRLMDAILLYIREYFVIGHTQESLCHNLGLHPKPNKKEMDELHKW